MSKVQRLIASIEDEHFISKMDSWYQSVNYKQRWATPIPTRLSYFVYWCTKTTLKQAIEVNSTVFAGTYYDASEEFEEYLDNDPASVDFELGYAFTVTKRTNEVHVGMYFVDDAIEAVFPIKHDCKTPNEFVRFFKENLVFVINGEPEQFYKKGGTEGRSFYQHVIEKEIKQLFMSV